MNQLTNDISQQEDIIENYKDEIIDIKPKIEEGKKENELLTQELQKLLAIQENLGKFLNFLFNRK